MKKFKEYQFFIYFVVFVLLVFFWKPFASIKDFFAKTLGFGNAALDTVTNKTNVILTNLGVLSNDDRGILTSIKTNSVVSPWSGNIYINSNGGIDAINAISVAQSKQIAQSIKNCFSLISGVDNDALISIFRNFSTPMQFASFCQNFHFNEGKTLYEYLSAPYYFGFISSLTNSGILYLNSIIQSKA